MSNLSKDINAGKPDCSFRKDERLCSKKIIDKLFAEGKSVFVFPLKMVYIETSVATTYHAQAGFAVSKKSFKHAVQRNLIKRRIREAYRLNKQAFYNELHENHVAVFFIYTAKEIADFAVINAAVIKGLKKLTREIHLKP